MNSLYIYPLSQQDDADLEDIFSDLDLDTDNFSAEEELLRRIAEEKHVVSYTICRALQMVLCTLCRIMFLIIILQRQTRKKLI